MSDAEDDIGAGMPGDPVLFKLLTEISIIANIADREFERLMPGSLTVAQFGVLNHLLRLGEQQTIGEIASAMRVAQPTMSSTVKKLVEKKYVQFIPDTEDLRIKRVKVSRSGRNARDRAVKAVAPSLAELTASLAGTDWQAMLPALVRLRMLMDTKT